MATKIYNATHTAAATTIQLVNIESDNGGKSENQVFPPGYFKLRFEALTDPTTQHGEIKIMGTTGPEEFTIQSSDVQDKDGNTFSSLQAARIYLLSFFFEPAALAIANSIQSQIDNGEVGGGAAFANDVTPANDDFSAVRIIPSLATLTTEVGDGNGPYLVSFPEDARGKSITVGNNDSSTGDGWVSADGGRSLQKVGSGTAQLKFDTGKNNSSDKLLSPRYQPYWMASCVTHEGTISQDLFKGNAGGAYGCKKESLGGNLNLKVNENDMLDLATWMVTSDNQSLDLSDMLGGVDWVAGTMYMVFCGRHASGAVIGAVGIISGTTIDMSDLAIRRVDGSNSQMKHADFSNIDIEMDENEKMFELRYGVGPWELSLISDFYRYFVSTYGDLAA